MARYLLDTNVFIQARNLHYGFDFCPAFWDWLRNKHQDGTIASIEQVFDELEDDELAAWAAACVGLGVRYVTPYNMLRRERARFVLGAR